MLWSSPSKFLLQFNHFYKWLYSINSVSNFCHHWIWKPTFWDHQSSNSDEIWVSLDYYCPCCPVEKMWIFVIGLDLLKRRVSHLILFKVSDVSWTLKWILAYIFPQEVLNKCQWGWKDCWLDWNIHKRLWKRRRKLWNSC